MARVNGVRFHRNGGPEVLTFEPVEIGEPKEGEVLIRQTAIGINYIDIQHRSGRYPSASFPVIPGMEGAGVIETVGPGVSDFRNGDRVAYMTHFPGAYLESRVVDANRVVKLPADITDEVGAAIMLKGLTAQYLLRGSYQVRPGETVLIHAAAGGVGLIMCQWARLLGARVIGTVSTEEKAALAKANGCDHVVLYSKEDVVARVLELTGGAGVPVVYDSVGADTFEKSLACLRTRGMLVSFGTPSGPIPPFDVFRLNRNHHMGQGGSLYLTSASVFDFTRQRSEYLERTMDLFEVVRTGQVRIRISKRYPLAEAAQAHHDLQSRQTTGSLVLVP